jgi:hypothetical protein
MGDKFLKHRAAVKVCGDEIRIYDNVGYPGDFYYSSNSKPSIRKLDSETLSIICEEFEKNTSRVRRILSDISVDIDDNVYNNPKEIPLNDNYGKDFNHVFGNKPTYSTDAKNESISKDKPTPIVFGDRPCHDKSKKNKSVFSEKDLAELGDIKDIENILGLIRKYFS